MRWGSVVGLWSRLFSVRYINPRSGVSVELKVFLGGWQELHTEADAMAALQVMIGLRT